MRSILLLSITLILASSCKEVPEEIIDMPQPQIALYDPVSSPSAHAIVYFAVSNLYPSTSAKLHLYNGDSCSQGQLINSANTSGSTSGIIVVVAGSYGNSPLSIDATVGSNRSACTATSYELIPPSTPTSVTLVSPAASPSDDATPMIKVGSNLLEGHKAQLYTASDCQDASLIGTSPFASAATVNVTANTLAVGSYNIYAKVLNEVDLEGSCSSVNLSYQVLPPSAGDQTTSGWYPEHIAIDDMNNDGKNDVIVTTGSKLEVFLGLGDGTVQTVIAQADEDGLSSAAKFRVVDFDGDGDKDVILGNSSRLNFFKGLGDGTFDSAVIITLQSDIQYRLSDLEVADFDGDGEYDVAVGGAFNDFGALTIYLGNGDGTLQPPVNYTSDRSINHLQAGDIDGDGDIDIMAASFSGDSLSIFKNNGNGTFAAKVDYTSGDGPYKMISGDLDGDSDIDVIIMNLWDQNFSVLLNDGTGLYAAPATFGSFLGFANYGYGLALGDLDGDSKIDLVFANERQDKYTVYSGVGDGTFGAGVDTAAADESNVALGDMDGDSDLDIVSTLSIPNTFGKIDIDLN